MDENEAQPLNEQHFRILAAVRAALARGNDGAALEALKGAPAIALIDGHVMRAKFFRASRRSREALEALNLAYSLSPSHKISNDIFAAITDIYIQDNDIDKAEETVDIGLTKYPDSISLLLRRAAVWAMRKDLDRAEGMVREAFVSPGYSASLDPQLANAIKAIQRLSPSRAYGLADEACLRHPTSGAIARLRGDLAFRLKKYDVALAAFEQALTLLKSGGLREAALAGRDRAQRAIAEKNLEIDQRSIALANIQTRRFLVCAITNVYNENFNLPIWLDHYGAHVGIKNCVVLDNGTDDGSTDNLRGAGRVPMPRGAVFNERHRMKIVTDLANNLLNYYDAVLYSDCDEILVPHPLKYENITHYCSKMKAPVVHAIGLNVREDITQDLPIRADLPILSQRSLVQFVSAMCKPLIIRKPISWGGGFHSCDHPPHFDDVYLFHLRHVDLGQALARLSITRNISFAREGGGKHHRREDIDLATAMYAKTHNMPVSEKFDFNEVLAVHKAGVELSFSGRYAVKRAANPKHLFRIPSYFRYSF